MSGHSLGSLPMWARRMVGDLERTVAESEMVHAHEMHKLRIQIIEADGARRLAEQRFEYAERNLRQSKATIRSLCDAISAAFPVDESPVGMDPREWIK